MKYTDKDLLSFILANPLLSASKLAHLAIIELGLSESKHRQLRRRFAAMRDVPNMERTCIEQGIDPTTVKNYWYKGKHYSIHAGKKNVDYNDLKDQIIEDMQNHAPEYKQFKREKQKDPHLLVLSPADIHIGKLARSFETGEEYNSQIAVKRTMEGVDGILQKTSGYDIDKIMFVIGNDVLHIDTPGRTTTGGTQQDTDGQWYDNFRMGKQLYVDIIDKLLNIADVHVVFNRSNHDHISGFFLADTIYSWFSKSKNITFDVSMMDRKYFKYGVNLIGSTHGDGAKLETLPLLMATEAAQWWADCRHRYIYSHHVHHKIAKDMIGVTIETLRSPSSADAWHHRAGYQHNPKAIEGFIHHPQDGQIGKFNHFF